MALSPKQRFALLGQDTAATWLRQQPDWVLAEIVRDEWWWTARPEQIPPPGDWSICLALCGRGFGKSRAGAEWVVERLIRYPYDRRGVPVELLVIAETLSDARLICLEGPAGILRILDRRGVGYRYVKSPRPIVALDGGQKIYCEGADDEDVGRGYNAAGVWADEIAKWKTPRASWYEGILPSLRVDLPGDHPRAFVTTTPKSIDLLREWIARTDGSVHLMRGSTFDNAENLSALVVRELEDRYAGTTLGRQELYGELLELADGALFKRADLESYRVDVAPADMIQIVVGVDPSLTGEDDEMGVVVAGRTRDGHLWILADESTMAVGRTAAVHVWNVLARYNAHLVVCESNLGKRWMEQVLRDAYHELVDDGLFEANTNPPLKLVDVKTGKKTRAEPVAMRSEQGRLHMVGPAPDAARLPALWTQMTEFTSWDSNESPDRLDALVHACRQLMLSERMKGHLASPLALSSTTAQLWRETTTW